MTYPSCLGFLCYLVHPSYLGCFQCGDVRLVYITDTFDSACQGRAHMSYYFPFLPPHSPKQSPKHDVVMPGGATHPIHQVMLARPIHRGMLARPCRSGASSLMPDLLAATPVCKLRASTSSTRRIYSCTQFWLVALDSATIGLHCAEPQQVVPLLKTRILLWMTNFSVHFFGMHRKITIILSVPKYPDRKIQKPTE